MSRTYSKGDRVESLKEPGTHGTVEDVMDDAVGVRWDGLKFTCVEEDLADVRPSKKPAPADAGPGYLVMREGNER